MSSINQIQERQTRRQQIIEEEAEQAIAKAKLEA